MILGWAVHGRRSHQHGGHLVLDGPGVVLGQGGLGARALAYAAAPEAARGHHHDIGAQALDEVVHPRLGSIAHGHHDDHRAHADDDAQCGEHAAQGVAFQRVQGIPQGVQELHASSSGAGSSSSVPLGVQGGEGGFVSHQEAVAELEQASGEAGDVRVMGHQHDGHAFAVELLEQGHHLDTSAGVQGAGGLVGHDDGRPVHHGPGYGHPLLLATGELGGHVVFTLGQTHRLQHLAGAGWPGPAEGCRRSAGAGPRCPGRWCGPRG